MQSHMDNPTSAFLCIPHSPDLRIPYFLVDIKVHNFLYHFISKNMHFIKLSSTLMVIMLLLRERAMNVKWPSNAKGAERSKMRQTVLVG